jgi:cytochrome P450
MSMSTAVALPIDLYSEQTRADPLPVYAEIRDAGPVVLLERGIVAMARFADVRAALGDWELFSSAVPGAPKGSLLFNDPPIHDTMRTIVMRPLMPSRLNAIRKRITTTAEALIADLWAKGTFDAATELAPHLPLTVVADLVGLPDEGRENMLVWARAFFNAAGPSELPLVADALPVVNEMLGYMQDPSLPQRLRPGGWAAELHGAVDDGEIDQEQFFTMLQGYVLPSLDTTIHATSGLIRRFAEHPDQWDLLRHQPELVNRAVNEGLRLEGPVQWIPRTVTRDHEIDGVTVPAKTRIPMLLAAANLDERRYPDPERFDVTREAADQLGLGYGTHHCAGASIARLEIAALIKALIPRVERFEIISQERADLVSLRGLKHLQIRIS